MSFSSGLSFSSFVIAMLVEENETMWCIALFDVAVYEFFQAWKWESRCPAANCKWKLLLKYLMFPFFLGWSLMISHLSQEIFDDFPFFPGDLCRPIHCLSLPRRPSMLVSKGSNTQTIEIACLSMFVQERDLISYDNYTRGRWGFSINTVCGFQGFQSNVSLHFQFPWCVNVLYGL